MSVNPSDMSPLWAGRRWTPDPVESAKVPAFDPQVGLYAAVREIDSDNFIAVPSGVSIQSLLGINRIEQNAAVAEPALPGVDFAPPATTNFELEFNGTVKSGLPITLVPSATQLGADVGSSADLSYTISGRGVTFAETGLAPGEVEVTAILGESGELTWTPVYQSTEFAPVIWRYTTVRDPAPEPPSTKQAASLLLSIVSLPDFVKISPEQAFAVGTNSFKFSVNSAFVINSSLQNSLSAGLVFQWRAKLNGTWTAIGAEFSSSQNAVRLAENADDFVITNTWNRWLEDYPGAVYNEQDISIPSAASAVALFAKVINNTDTTSLGLTSRAIISEN